MKKNSKETKKKQSSKKIQKSRSAGARKSMVVAKKIAKKPQKKSFLATKNKKILNSNNRFVAVIALIMVVFFLVTILYVYLSPGLIANFSYKKSEVLNMNTGTSDNNYIEDNEDKLMMFATLAYEDAYRAVKRPSILQPDGSMQKDINQPIAMCQATSLGEYSSEQMKGCLLSDSVPDSNRSNMFKSQDMIGTVVLKPIDKDKPKTPGNVFGSVMQEIMARLLVDKRKGGDVGLENSEAYYFGRIASVDSSLFLDDWDLMDSYNATSIPGYMDEYGIMTAHTYKKGKDIVIAYRGTDLTDIADWVVNDGAYAMNNDSKQDTAAKEYARAIAEAYNGDGKKQYNIYITGHSLGGYLAQIAASELLDVSKYGESVNPYNVKRVVYFNGMGMFFTKKSMKNPKNKQIITRNRLVAFNTSPNGKIDDKLLLVHMFGDPVSSLGYHYGRVKTIKPTAFDGSPFTGISVNNNLMYKNWVDYIQESLSKVYPGWENKRMENLDGINNIISKLANNIILPLNMDMSEIKDAVMFFDSRSVLSYAMTAHSTDHFFYTDFYHNYNENYELSRYRQQIVNNKIVDGYPKPLEGSSITGQPFNTEHRNNDVGAYGPMCSFDIKNPNNAANSSSIIEIKKGQYVTGELICHSRSGFKDPGSINASSFAQEWPIKVKVVSVSGPIEANQDSSGLVTSYKWVVTLMGNKSIFTRLGSTNFFLKNDVITSNNNLKNKLLQNPKNNTDVFLSKIKLVKDINYSPSYDGRTYSPSDEANPIVKPTKPQCTFSAPSIIKTEIWPWRYVYSNGYITCSDATGLSDALISSSDIIASPANRIKDISVGSAMKSSSNPNLYRWTVRFRGNYYSRGLTRLNLKKGAIVNLAGSSNGSTYSDLINVTR